MGLLVSLLLFPIIHPSRTHKLVFVGLRILVLPLIIVFYVVLVRNFYTSDPATACSWCRYLSCWPTAANNVSGRQRWLYILGDPPGRFRLSGGILMHWRRPLTALQGHRAVDILDFVVSIPVALYGPRLDVRLAPPLSGACCLCATSPFSTRRYITFPKTPSHRSCSSLSYIPLFLPHLLQLFLVGSSLPLWAALLRLILLPSCMSIPLSSYFHSLKQEAIPLAVLPRLPAPLNISAFATLAIRSLQTLHDE